MRRAPGRAIVVAIVTPKSIVEITPLVVAQIECRERAMRARARMTGAAAAQHHETKPDRLTTSQKFRRT
jgi:hypothetical protein